MKHRFATVLLVLVAASAALVSGAAANRGHHHGRVVHAARQAHGHQLYRFGGTLLAAPGANASSVSLQVTTGNRPALRALLGSSQNEVFTLGSGTEVLVWSHGVPRVGSTADLQAGQYVTINVRDARGSSLADVLATPAGIVSQHAAPGASQPLYLFVGTVSGPQSGGKVTLDVKGGNHNALHLLVGQSTKQAFTYDSGTIFLLWQGKVPTVIDPSQLKPGDRITVRIRAPHGSTLAQVEAAAAKHVGDHEPGV